MFAPLAALASLALALVGDNKYRTYFSRAVNDDPPTVVLDSATLIGFTDDAVTSFTGIPFAEAPYAPFHLTPQFCADSAHSTRIQQSRKPAFAPPCTYQSL